MRTRIIALVALFASLTLSQRDAVADATTATPAGRCSFAPSPISTWLVVSPGGHGYAVCYGDADCKNKLAECNRHFGHTNQTSDDILGF